MIAAGEAQWVSVSVEKISSLDDERVKPYRSVRRPIEHHRRGWFVAEGPEMVCRLLKSSVQIISLFVTEERAAEVRKWAEGREPSVPLYMAPREVMEGITGFDVFQGMLALASIPGEGAEELVSPAGDPGRMVALDGITNAENVGVIMRNAAALGVGRVLTSSNTASPWLRRAVRVSMGGILALAIEEKVDLPVRLKALREEGVQIWAASLEAGADVLWEVDLHGPICLVLGAERGGISEAVRQQCDGALILPMAEGQNSLNVASASAVILAEMARQQSSRSTPADRVRSTGG